MGESEDFAASVIDSDVLVPPSTLRTRRIMMGITLVLVVTMPVLNYYDSETWEYVLAAALAFTIGTNAMISVVTVKVDDKADRMEARILMLMNYIRELLEQLEESSDTLKDFSVQMEQVNIPAMIASVETARIELAPALDRFSEVDLAQISELSVQALEAMDMIDSEKVKGVLAPFMVDDPVILEPLPFGEDPFFDDERPVGVEWFPPPPEM